MKAGAKFIGYQEMTDEPAIPLFNISGDHPRTGSTVFAGTLRELGIEPPTIPTFEQWKDNATKYRDNCDVQGCENEVYVDDYGVCICEEHVTPEIETYLRRQANKDAARW